MIQANALKKSKALEMPDFCGSNGWLDHLRACHEHVTTDETALFYHSLPDKTLCFKGKTWSGGKLAKDCLSFYV